MTYKEELARILWSLERNVKSAQGELGDAKEKRKMFIDSMSAKLYNEVKKLS